MLRPAGSARRKYPKTSPPIRDDAVIPWLTLTSLESILLSCDYRSRCYLQGEAWAWCPVGVSRSTGRKKTCRNSSEPCPCPPATGTVYSFTAHLFEPRRDRSTITAYSYLVFQIFNWRAPVTNRRQTINQKLTSCSRISQPCVLEYNFTGTTFYSRTSSLSCPSYVLWRKYR